MDTSVVTLYHRIPIDVRAGFIVITAIGLLLQLDVLMNQLLYYNLKDFEFIRNCVVYLLSISILMGLVFLQTRDFFQSFVAMHKLNGKKR